MLSQETVSYFKLSSRLSCGFVISSFTKNVHSVYVKCTVCIWMPPIWPHIPVTGKMWCTIRPLCNQFHWPDADVICWSSVGEAVPVRVQVHRHTCTTHHTAQPDKGFNIQPCCFHLGFRKKSPGSLLASCCTDMESGIDELSCFGLGKKKKRLYIIFVYCMVKYVSASACLWKSQSFLLHYIFEAFYRTSLNWTPSVPMWQKDVLHKAQKTSALFFWFENKVIRVTNVLCITGR